MEYCVLGIRDDLCGGGGVLVVYRSGHTAGVKKTQLDFAFGADNRLSVVDLDSYRPPRIISGTALGELKALPGI